MLVPVDRILDIGQTSMVVPVGTPRAQLHNKAILCNHAFKAFFGQLMAKVGCTYFRVRPTTNNSSILASVSTEKYVGHVVSQSPGGVA
jgi:hypothetical protein